MRKNNILLILSLGLGLPLYAQSYTLQECKELALKNNFSLESSRLEVMKAEEIKDQAFTKYFPEIKAESFAMQFLNPVINLSIDDISNAGTRDMLNLLYNEYGIALGMDDELSFIESGEMYSISLTQPIFAGGQIVNANKLADLGIKAAQVQSEISERDFLLELEQTYYLSLSLGEKKRHWNLPLIPWTP
ncbi:MAG: TolC family protein [Candidatus Cryptobacteroides sp.]